MLKDRLISWSKTQDSFFNSRAPKAIWLISSICFAIVFLGIISFLLWGRISNPKPPLVPPMVPTALNREVREPIKPFVASKQASEKPVEKSLPPLEDGLTEKPEVSAQTPLNPDPSRIQDVSPDDTPGKGMLSRDLEKEVPPVLAETQEHAERKPASTVVKPSLVAENSNPARKASPPDIEKPTPASLPEVSVPTEKKSASSLEKSVGAKAESVLKDPKEMTVMVAVGNIRKGPSVKDKVVFTVAGGDALQITDQKGNWYAVRLDNDRSGWAHRSLFQGASAPSSKIVSSSPKGGKGKNVINGIRTVVTDPNQAQIIFELSGYHPPEIMVLEGEAPRVVCDFFGGRLAPGVKKNLSVKTGVVKRIRVGVHKGSKPKVRVVLDLKAGQNYAVEQFFFEKEKYFALMVNSGR